MIKKYIHGLLLAAGVVTLVGGVAPVLAVNPFGGGACTNNPGSSVCKAKNRENRLINRDIRNIVNLLMFALGLIAVIVIIIGGIMYTVSSGDSSKIKTAKDTILYAVIGLVVAIAAYAIVNFIVTNI